MSRDDLYAYYRRHYVPNNATLVVVGDVDADDVLRRAEAVFRPDPWRERRAAQARPVEPPQIGERRVAPRAGGDDRLSEAGVSGAGRDR